MLKPAWLKQLWRVLSISPLIKPPNKPHKLMNEPHTTLRHHMPRTYTAARQPRSNVAFKRKPSSYHSKQAPTILDKIIGDNRLKITPEIKFPSEQSKFPPPSTQTMLMIICTNPCLLLIFFSQHWTGGVEGSVYLGNLVNCDDHVLLYTVSQWILARIVWKSASE